MKLGCNNETLMTYLVLSSCSRLAYVDTMPQHLH